MSLIPVKDYEAVVREISAIKKEPQWMLEYRLKAYEAFKTTDAHLGTGSLHDQFRGLYLLH